MLDALVTPTAPEAAAPAAAAEPEKTEPEAPAKTPPAKKEDKPPAAAAPFINFRRPTLICEADLLGLFFFISKLLLSSQWLGTR